MTKARWRCCALLLALAGCQPEPAATEGQPSFPDAAPHEEDPGPGGRLRRDFWIAAGTVTDVIQHAGLIYVAGSFTYVGPDTGPGVAIDRATGAAPRPPARLAGTVYAVTSDGAGGWYVGGEDPADGEYLVHLTAAGERDPAFDPSLAGPVRALVAGPDRLYAGGGRVVQIFDRSSGAARVVSLEQCEEELGPPDVTSLALLGHTLYVGGTFERIAGVDRGGLAAIDTATGLVTDWDPVGAGQRAHISALAAAGSTIYAAGDFMGPDSGRIVALDTSGGWPPAWSASADNRVAALATGGGAVYAAGWFTEIAGQPRAGLARLDGATGGLTAWNPGADGPVRDLALAGELVYAGGEFTVCGGKRRRMLAALDADGVATDWNPVAGGTVETVAVSGGTLYAGGEFSSVGGVARGGLAAFHAGAGIATGWNPAADGPVLALTRVEGTLYAVGAFSAVDGHPRGGVVAIDLATGEVVPSFQPPPVLEGTAWTVAAGDDRLYIGGRFTRVGDQPRSRLAALDRATGAVTGWDPGPDHDVHALAVAPGTVFAGGRFTTIGGQERRALAALDARSGLATAWDPQLGTEGGPLPGAPPNIGALAVDGEVLYAGGTFFRAGGQARQHLAALDLTSARATSWMPARPAGGSPVVFSLGVGDGTIYAGGGFWTVSDRSRNFLLPLDAATGADTGWDPRLEGGFVSAISESPDAVVVGGQLAAAGGTPRAGIAVFDP